jgi:hypothetical protein
VLHEFEESDAVIDVGSGETFDFDLASRDRAL